MGGHDQEPKGVVVHGVAALAVAYITSQFYRSALAVIAPEVGADLGLDAGRLGWLSAAWFLGFAAAQLPVGVALDRFGPRRTVSFLMGSAVIGAVLFALAPSFGIALAAEALIGIGCAPVLMGSMVYISRWVPLSRFAQASSLVIAIGGAGTLFSATPLAALAAALGWRGAMLLVAGLTLLAAVLTYAVIRDWPPGSAPAEAHRETLAEALAGIGEVMRIRALWPLLPMSFAGYAVLIAVRGLWAGPYLDAVYGLAPVSRGNVLLLMSAAMVGGTLLYSPLDRLFGTRRGIVAGGAVATIAGYAALTAWPDAGLAAVTLQLMAVGTLGSTYAVLMTHGRAFVPAHLTGRGVTFLNFINFIGVGCVQAASGRLVDGALAAGLGPAATYSLLFAGMGALLALALTFYLFSRDAPP